MEGSRTRNVTSAQKLQAAAHLITQFGSGAFSGIGLVALAAGIGWRVSVILNDELGLKALALVSCVAAGEFLFLGSK